MIISPSKVEESYRVSSIVPRTAMGNFPRSQCTLQREMHMRMKIRRGNWLNEHLANRLFLEPIDEHFKCLAKRLQKCLQKRFNERLRKRVHKRFPERA